ncbi:MAG TPA: hypothetical protein VFM54_22200 [Micromonosporaceae bacterium]|nr:hypothetical protein [Micromonosporaceae bacterium]
MFPSAPPPDSGDRPARAGRPGRGAAPRDSRYGPAREGVPRAPREGAGRDRAPRDAGPREAGPRDAGPLREPGGRYGAAVPDRDPLDNLFDERRERPSGRRGPRGPGVPGGGPGRRGPGAPPDAEPAEDPVPVRRLLSLGIAGFAGLLAIGLIFGAQTSGPGAARVPYASVIFGVQVLFVLAWTVAVRPPAPRVVAAVGLVTALAADVAAVWPEEATAAAIGYVAVGGFVAGVLGQLSRRPGRVRVTESLGTSLVVVIGVVAFAMLIVLTRLPLGTQAIVVTMAATGVSLVVARVTDAIVPYPRLAPAVPRGAAGIVVGAMCGTFAAAVLGSLIVEFNPQKGALVGLVAALAAVLADLAVGYAEAGRVLAGEPGALWLVRHLQGPLGGFALAAPAAYVISVIFLVPSF